MNAWYVIHPRKKTPDENYLKEWLLIRNAGESFVVLYQYKPHLGSILRISDSVALGWKLDFLIFTSTSVKEVDQSKGHQWTDEPSSSSSNQ